MWRLSTRSCGWSLFATTLLLLLTAVTGAPTTTKPEYDDIKGVLELENYVDVCTVDALGNTIRNVTLDFSKADPTALNEFLGRKKTTDSKDFAYSRCF